MARHIFTVMRALPMLIHGGVITDDQPGQEDRSTYRRLDDEARVQGGGVHGAHLQMTSGGTATPDMPLMVVA